MVKMIPPDCTRPAGARTGAVVERNFLYNDRRWNPQPDRHRSVNPWNRPQTVRQPDLTAEQLQAYRACTYRWNPGPGPQRGGGGGVCQPAWVCFPLRQQGSAHAQPVDRRGRQPAGPPRPQRSWPGHLGLEGQFAWQAAWYYSRLAAPAQRLVSLDMLPCFYALSPNYGDPETITWNSTNRA